MNGAGSLPLAPDVKPHQHAAMKAINSNLFMDGVVMRNIGLRLAFLAKSSSPKADRCGAGVSGSTIGSGVLSFASTVAWQVEFEAGAP